MAETNEQIFHRMTRCVGQVHINGFKRSRDGESNTETRHTGSCVLISNGDVDNVRYFIATVAHCIWPHLNVNADDKDTWIVGELSITATCGDLRKFTPLDLALGDPGKAPLSDGLIVHEVTNEVRKAASDRLVHLNFHKMWWKQPTTSPPDEPVHDNGYSKSLIGIPAVLVGYPDISEERPLVLVDGRIASDPAYPLAGETLEDIVYHSAPSISGFSGGAVIVDPPPFGAGRLAGINIGHIDKSLGKFRSSEHTGISIMIPAWEIRQQLLEHGATRTLT